MASAGLDSGESIGYTGVTEEDALEAVKLCLELGDDVQHRQRRQRERPARRGLPRERRRQPARGPADREAASTVDLKNKRGWTPVTLAEGIYTQNSNSKNPELERLLLAHGGKPSPPGIERDAYAVIAEETREP